MDLEYPSIDTEAEEYIVHTWYGVWRLRLVDGEWTLIFPPTVTPPMMGHNTLTSAQALALYYLALGGFRPAEVMPIVQRMGVKPPPSPPEE